MMPANYFHDGYEQPGYIAAVARLHGSLRFTYRPALVEDRSRLSDAARALTAPQYDRQAALFAAGKLVVWDVADASGRAVPIAAEALLRLQPELFVKLLRIVLGALACDLDPQWSASERQQVLDEQIEAALAGRPIADVQLEHAEKN